MPKLILIRRHRQFAGVLCGRTIIAATDRHLGRITHPRSRPLSLSEVEQIAALMGCEVEDVRDVRDEDFDVGLFLTAEADEEGGR